MYFAITFIKQE